MIQKKQVLILLLAMNCALAQLTNKSRFDSLSYKNFYYLNNRFDATIYNRDLSQVYGQAWLKKAKAEKSNHQLSLAYKAAIINSEKSLRLFYADSMIYFANKTNNHELIGSAYLTKGVIYYDRMEHIKALDNYLVADRYLSQCNNKALIYKVKYGIALIKLYLGFYEESISLFKECISYFKDENDRAYLNSLHCLGLCYNHTGKFKLASLINQTGIREGRLFEDTGIEFYFNHSEGINQCCIGNYTTAIEKLNSALPNIIELKDHTNEAVSYFYIGKAYWSLKRFKEAVLYFKKVDQIFQKEKYLLPDLRKGYEYLIDYYKQKGDTLSQLFYIDQLLKVDKILAEDYKYLLKKIVKEYDTKELINTKNSIEYTILFTRIGACIIILVSGFVILYLIRKNRRNLKKFEELMKRDTSNQPILQDKILEVSDIETPEINEPKSSNKQSARDISPEIETAIVKKLEKFELAKKYLEKDMTLTKMAIILHTNPKYVAKVIFKHRGKRTIDYITALKLDYIVEMLKTDSKYRNYTNKALGEEAGFRTTQSFTRAFKLHTDITPTYFSTQLKKSESTGDSL